MMASTISELVPAAASTPGIVNTPVPMMLPITSPVAEVRPSPWLFCWLVGVGWAGPSGGSWTGRVLAALDMPIPLRRPLEQATASRWGP